ncbi:YbgF trimerization domain-containing protein [uncultured Pseudoteredinibacter sp.]|uniref:YbgF trimerization domain-containing protein n=1 Tax=uncultured Pseudoteredinibacter sp. TaxID=1641701 RepID=UPI0026093589|nr:YbgF trimerization domain-containing protein [uncultured Pseudoteredinibacter sp.]
MKAPYLTAALAAVSLSAAQLSFAQAQVVDTQPIVDNRSPAISQSVPVSNSSADSQAQVFYQLQQLQQEVLQLRGLVEEQAFELKRFKQQRMDDYLDLDRRLASLAKTAPTSTPGSLVSAPSTVANVASAATQAVSAGDLQDYRAAIDLVLHKQDYDQGEKLLLQHIANYPNSKFLPNSQYWLGQIYLIKRDYEQAKQRFLIVKEQFPDHDKYIDAVFKLGKAYHLLGDNASAVPHLQQAAKDSGSVGKLAEAYLAKNFR